MIRTMSILAILVWQLASSHPARAGSLDDLPDDPMMEPEDPVIEADPYARPFYTGDLYVNPLTGEFRLLEPKLMPDREDGFTPGLNGNGFTSGHGGGQGSSPDFSGEGQRIDGPRRR